MPIERRHFFRGRQCINHINDSLCLCNFCIQHTELVFARFSFGISCVEDTHTQQFGCVGCADRHSRPFTGKQRTNFSSRFAVQPNQHLCGVLTAVVYVEVYFVAICNHRFDIFGKRPRNNSLFFVRLYVITALIGCVEIITVCIIFLDRQLSLPAEVIYCAIRLRRSRIGYCYPFCIVQCFCRR